MTAARWRCSRCGRYLHARAVVLTAAGIPKSRCQECGPVVALYVRGHDVTNAKTTGQEQSLLALPQVSHETFLRIVDSVPAGTEVSVNTLRSRLDAAEVPERARGGLFSKATKARLLEPVWVGDGDDRTPKTAASSGPTAHLARVRVYRRTTTRLHEVST
ncbi:hypothetical protein SAMN04487781_4028 [Cellulosimicrobium cellulans]|nr:hypothetical protein SAMN04487781_4028 [Cellulosimicrobium cellulans]